MKVQPPALRIQKLLDRVFKTPAYAWDDITDPRRRRGRRWTLKHLINAAFAILSARYFYDIALGPRTEVTLGNILVHAGEAPVERTFTQEGGPVPDQGYVASPDNPTLNPGSRYILFFGQDNWFYSPLVSGYAFRVEDIEGKRIVLGPTGTPVMGIDVTAVRLGTAKIVDRASQPDPLRPLPVGKIADKEMLAQAAAALDATAFVKRSAELAKALGAQFGRPNLIPVPRPDWRRTRTSPPHNQ